MDRPTKMRLSYGDSVDLLGGTRITVLKSADRHPDFFTLRLQRIDYEEQVEGPSPEPEQEQPLQGPDGEAPTADPGIGAPGPLPDAGPQEGQVVEGVGGKAKLDTKFALMEGRDVWLLLEDAVRSARDCGATSGALSVRRRGWLASCAWGRDGISLASLTQAEED